MNPAAGVALDAATLVFTASYGLSALGWVATRGRPLGERAAWWRVVGPLVGSAVLVLLGFGSALWDAWRDTPDHCGSTPTHAPTLCWLHPPGAAGRAPAEWLALVVLLCAAGTLVLRIAEWARAASRLHGLIALGDMSAAEAVRWRLAAAGVAWPGPITFVRTDAPLCGVTGWRRPRLLLSSAVVERMDADALAVMVAHERAHVVRRDPLWRAVAHLARVGHLPGLGGPAVAAWALAAELACDQDAALACGSPVRVAETLVRYRRAFGESDAPTLALVPFDAPGELETRVHALLAPLPPARPGLRRRWWGFLALVAGWALLPGIHAALEALLRLLHA